MFLARIIMIGGLDPGYKELSIDWLTPLQQKLVSQIELITPVPESALLSGILLGEKSSLPHWLRLQLQDTSTIHMVVVSGQNLTILAGFLITLAPWVGRRIAILITLFGCLAYAVLTGFQVPVIRATIMAVATLTAQLLGKNATSWYVLALSAGLMLLFNPNWILSISFQLSFLATLGLVVMAPIITPKLSLVPKVLRGDLATTISAQALTFPVIAATFGQVSLVGVLANVMVLWTIPLVMISGFMALMVSFISETLGSVVVMIPTMLLTYFIYMVDFFAGLPAASIISADIGVWGWLGYYLIVGGVLWGLKSKM